MEIEEALTTYLLSQSGLTALIDRRFFYDERPENSTLPALLCINISDVKDHTLTAQQKLESPMLQFTSYGATRASARAVANQVKTALADYVGTMSGIEVQYIKLVNELPSTEQNEDGTIKVRTVDQEYEINFVKE
jgi:hypothetical protein